MTLYRDCNSFGADFDSVSGGLSIGTVTVFGANNSILEIINLDAPEINLLDLSFENDCAEGLPNICIQRGAYQFNLNLPLSMDSYHIVYQRCCRNTTLSNVSYEGSEGMTFVQEITPLAQSICNNSPFFESFNKPIICANEYFTVSHGASDADQDNLIFSFCSPLNGGSEADPAPNPETPPPYDQINYLYPDYSGTFPMGSATDIAIDSQSGVISGTATLQGQYVVGICIDEFRNGQLLSTTRRDFQFAVVPCDSSTFVDSIYADVLVGEIYEGVAINNDTTLIFNTTTALGCDSSTVHFVNALVSNTSSSNNSRDFHIFPNPSKHNASITIETSPSQKPYELKLYDAVGQLKKSQIGSSSGLNALDVSTLTPGVYYLSLETADEAQVQCFLKM